MTCSKEGFEQSLEETEQYVKQLIVGYRRLATVRCVYRYLFQKSNIGHIVVSITDESLLLIIRQRSQNIMDSSGAILHW